MIPCKLKWNNTMRQQQRIYNNHETFSYLNTKKKNIVCVCISFSRFIRVSFLNYEKKKN